MPRSPNVDNLSLLWASVETAPELAALHASLFPDPWSADAIGRLLAHPGATSLIARTPAPNQIVGVVLAQLAVDEAEILSLGVAKPWQRLGVATRLVEGIIRASKNGGANRLHLEVAADNIPAMTLYRAHGFAEVNRRRGYYTRMGAAPVDALMLSRDL